MAPKLLLSLVTLSVLGLIAYTSPVFAQALSDEQLRKFNSEYEELDQTQKARLKLRILHEVVWGLIKEREQEGRYSEAIPMAKGMHDQFKDSYGDTHKMVGFYAAVLGLLHLRVNDRPGADWWFQYALPICERTDENDRHVCLGMIYLGKARLRHVSLDYMPALELYDKAVKEFSRLSDQAQRAPWLVQVLSSISQLSMEAKSPKTARRFYELAVEAMNGLPGGDHISKANALTTLGTIAASAGDYVQARTYYLHAAEMLKRIRGPDHPDLATVMGSLGRVERDVGDDHKAVGLFRDALNIAKRYSHRGLGGLSEAQQLSFLASTRDYLFHYLSLPANLVSESDAYSAVLAYKNLAFRTLAEERTALLQRAETPVIHNLLEQRKTLVRQLSLLIHKGEQGARIAASQRDLEHVETLLTLQGDAFRLEDKNPAFRDLMEAKEQNNAVLRQILLLLDKGERVSRVNELQREAERIETELTRKIEEFRLKEAEAVARPAEVCRALPRDAALLDYVRYIRYSPARRSEPGRFEIAFTVFILRGGRCTDVRRVELEKEEALARATGDFVKALRRKVGDADMLPLAKNLGDLLLPLEVRQTVSDVKTLFVSPDPILSRLPFGLLSADGKAFLLESHTVTYLTSGLDLATVSADSRKVGKVPGEKVFLIGNPEYGVPAGPFSEMKVGGPEAQTYAECGLKSTHKFDPLNGTAGEVAAIKILAERSGGTAILKQEKDAAEPWVHANIAGHHVVHFATHGYFAGTACAAETTPLLRAGIALAGANQRAQATSGEQDGILTALEVTSLDLRAADLVVLSACDTGVGELESGQEVLGLRRAFSVAGARSLVTSFWKVPDEQTKNLMVDFYERLWGIHEAGGQPIGKAKALQDAQLKMLRKNRQRYNGESLPWTWGAWALSGDWR